MVSSTRVVRYELTAVQHERLSAILRRHKSLTAQQFQRVELVRGQRERLIEQTRLAVGPAVVAGDLGSGVAGRRARVRRADVDSPASGRGLGERQARERVTAQLARCAGDRPVPSDIAQLAEDVVAEPAATRAVVLGQLTRQVDALLTGRAREAQDRARAEGDEELLAQVADIALVLDDGDLAEAAQATRASLQAGDRVEVAVLWREAQGLLKAQDLRDRDWVALELLREAMEGQGMTVISAVDPEHGFVAQQRGSSLGVHVAFQGGRWVETSVQVVSAGKPASKGQPVDLRVHQEQCNRMAAATKDLRGRVATWNEEETFPGHAAGVYVLGSPVAGTGRPRRAVEETAEEPKSWQAPL